MRKVRCEKSALRCTFVVATRQAAADADGGGNSALKNARVFARGLRSDPGESGACAWLTAGLDPLQLFQPHGQARERERGQLLVERVARHPSRKHLGAEFHYFETRDL